MAAYSTWKGYLKLSLVSIPICAYSTNSSENSPIRLHQLHAECKSRIKHRKVCPVHGEVSSDQIVSGYEYAKNEYVIIDPAELSKLRSEDQKAITVQEFIQPDALDPIYWNGVTLFLMPDGPIGQRPDVASAPGHGRPEALRDRPPRLAWQGRGGADSADGGAIGDVHAQLRSSDQQADDAGARAGQGRCGAGGAEAGGNADRFVHAKEIRFQQIYRRLHGQADGVDRSEGGGQGDRSAPPAEDRGTSST